jgi:hypothetical protein
VAQPITKTRGQSFSRSPRAACGGKGFSWALGGKDFSRPMPHFLGGVFLDRLACQKTRRAATRPVAALSFFLAIGGGSCPFSRGRRKRLTRAVENPNKALPIEDVRLRGRLARGVAARRQPELVVAERSLSARTRGTDVVSSSESTHTLAIIPLDVYVPTMLELRDVTEGSLR